jgi:hypothetical protein
MSQTLKDNDASSGDGKRIILNEKNFVVWKRLTLVQIGTVNARTLELDFMPYLNELRRPVPPTALSNKLRRQPLVLAPGDTSGVGTLDGSVSSSDGRSLDVESDFYDMGPYVCSTFAEFEQLNTIYKAARDQEKADSTAIRETLLAILGGLSSSMKAYYSSYSTPTLLWAELSRTKDPVNRTLDTSAEDAYRAFVMKPNQSIPDFLKAVRAIEDRCTASGAELHLGFESQKKLRLKLDHRFSQTVILLSLQTFDSIETMEKQMTDMWDSYVAAEGRNVKPLLSVAPEANSTLAAGKRKVSVTTTGFGKPGDVKRTACTKCARSHNVKFACDACYFCGKLGHMSRDCLSRPVRPQANVVEGGSSGPVASAAITPDAPFVKVVSRWEPSTGLMHR